MSNADYKTLLRRLEATEEALAEIERIACDGIHKFGITQEDAPANKDAWFKIGNAILSVCAPIRDKARSVMES